MAIELIITLIDKDNLSTCSEKEKIYHSSEIYHGLMQNVLVTVNKSSANIPIAKDPYTATCSFEDKKFQDSLWGIFRISPDNCLTFAIVKNSNIECDAVYKIGDSIKKNTVDANSVKLFYLPEISCNDNSEFQYIYIKNRTNPEQYIKLQLQIKNIIFSIEDRFTIVKKLNEGANPIYNVYLAKYRQDYLRQFNIDYPHEVVIKFPGSLSNRSHYEQSQQHMERSRHIQLKFSGHPGLPKIIDILTINNRDQKIPCLVMEKLPGMPLDTIFSPDNLPDFTELLLYIQQLIDIISYLHHHNVIHRGICLPNILVNTKQKRIYLVGLGSSKEMIELYDVGEKNAQTITDFSVRTAYPSNVLASLSPAFLTNPAECDESADIYSLGAIFYQLLIGVSPYHSRLMSKIEDYKQVESKGEFYTYLYYFKNRIAPYSPLIMLQKLKNEQIGEEQQNKYIIERLHQLDANCLNLSSNIISKCLNISESNDHYNNIEEVRHDITELSSLYFYQQKYQLYKCRNHFVPVAIQTDKWKIRTRNVVNEPECGEYAGWTEGNKGDWYFFSVAIHNDNRSCKLHGVFALGILESTTHSSLKLPQMFAQANASICSRLEKSDTVSILLIHLTSLRRYKELTIIATGHNYRIYWGENDIATKIDFYPIQSREQDARTVAKNVVARKLVGKGPLLIASGQLCTSLAFDKIVTQKQNKLAHMVKDIYDLYAQGGTLFIWQEIG